MATTQKAPDPDRLDAKDRSPSRRPRLLYICDWLPPDFGAVGQYSELFARQLACSGQDVVLGGLSSHAASRLKEEFPNGSLTTIKLHASQYRKENFAKRLLWTFKTNTKLVFALWRSMRWADEILFTGSPPLLLHWIAPLNLILRKRLVYRITDFHPECLIAAQPRPSVWLDLLYRLTLFWRRRVDIFEVLGEDQNARLREIGISADRIRTKRDPSPVKITPLTAPLPRPPDSAGKLLLLYSGNWGVAHDYETFVEGYRAHHERGSGRILLWLNAVGANASKVEAALRAARLPYIRGLPVPIDQLDKLLVTPDAHLITLSDPFVGFVLPSKVYGCVASGLPVLFVGSDRSDVHLVCREGIKTGYERVDVGASEACWQALERLSATIGK